MKVDLVLLATTSLIGGSFVTLARFEHTAGPDRASIAVPSPERDRGKLLVFVRPDCPCTLSTLENLKSAGLSERLRIHVIVSHNSDPQANAFAKDALGDWSKSLMIEGDPHLQKSNRYGAMTSGLTLWITQDGHVGFRGGITGARGESGPNIALLTLEKAVATDRAVSKPLPVYGCRL